MLNYKLIQAVLAGDEAAAELAETLLGKVKVVDLTEAEALAVKNFTIGQRLDDQAQGAVMAVLQGALASDYLTGQEISDRIVDPFLKDLDRIERVLDRLVKRGVVVRGTLPGDDVVLHRWVGGEDRRALGQRLDVMA